MVHTHSSVRRVVGSVLIAVVTVTGLPVAGGSASAAGTGSWSHALVDTASSGIGSGPLTGTISGSPTAGGATPAVLRVLDTPGQEAEQQVVVSAVAGPSVTLDLPAGEVDVEYSATPGLTGGATPVMWTASGLPHGLSVDAATGAITGTPTTSGNWTVELTATDADGVSDTADANLVVAAVPQLAVGIARVDPGEAVSLVPVVTGGTRPFVFTLGEGAVLPDGFALDPSTGEISGSSTVSDTWFVPVVVTDAFGVSSTTQGVITVRAPVVLTLDTSTTTTVPGEVLLLTLDGLPALSSVTLVDRPDTGLLAGTDTMLGTWWSDEEGQVVILVEPDGLGRHRIQARFAGSDDRSAAVSNEIQIEVTAPRGSVLITQFRLSGPGGADDQYVELTNVSSGQVDVSGFAIESASGQRTVLPARTRVLPPGGRFLVVGPGSAATFADLRAVENLGSGGVQLVAPDSAGTRVDAAGSTSGAFSLGTPLPELSGTPTADHAWVRLRPTGVLQDTSDNRADFLLVSADGQPVGGVPSVVGGTTPASSDDPVADPSLQSSLLDLGTSLAAAPNRVTVRRVGGNPGSLVIRRVLTNQGRAPLGQVRLRIISMSEVNGPLVAPATDASTAWLRAVAPTESTSQVMTGEGAVTVQNLTPVDPRSGGLNSTYDVPLPEGGLAPGASIPVSLTFDVDRGGRFQVVYQVETDPQRF